MSTKIKFLLSYVNVLTSSSGTNYVLNEHEDFDKYDPYAIPSEVLPCSSYLASLVNQTNIIIDLSCWRAHLAVIMSLTDMKILTNITHMEYLPR